MGINQKTLALLVQLGAPRSPEIRDVRAYLRKFLGDPRVVDTHPLLWKFILHGLVIPFRPRKTAHLYSRIWDGREFPLVKFTNSFAQKVNHYCGEGHEVRPCYLLSSPGFDEQLDYWEQHKQDFSKILVLMQFPQYCEATTASGYDLWSAALAKRVEIPHFEFVTSYHRLKSFIDLSAQKIDQAILQAQGNGRPMEGLVLSFHGIPLRRILYKKDPYYSHCRETFELIRSKVKGLSSEKIHCTFQSRFGKEQWIGPGTDDFIEEQIRKKGGGVWGIYAPSFVVDCLETLDELGHELQGKAQERGGEIILIPCLNDDNSWAKAYAKDIEALGGEREESCSYPPQGQPQTPEISPPPLTPKAKASIKVIFLTLFFDLMGFSIIFPLFPALVEYYLAHDRDHFLLEIFFQGVHGIERFLSLPHSPSTTVVLFGGLMGCLYSLLQFVAAPFWGAISDKWGRKKTLFITTSGLTLSYLLWIFSGSFGLLILSRILGGLMAGNISVATAAIADVTPPAHRAKGMAFVGVAFALGFVLGPAIGGLLGGWDLSALYPLSIQWGINPFSLPALFAFLLGCFNLFLITRRFEETYNPQKTQQERTANVLRLWKGLPLGLVNRVNGAYFLFICIFSGMEFTLTFLAVERLGYSPMDNALMFVFIGLILALVQGGPVRKKAHKVGERTIAFWGMVVLIPGLWVLGIAESTVALYGGLFFLSVGSAMIIPCLTALVSLYTPCEMQGKALGIFRSLGALGRVVGPLVISFLYWKNGAQMAYFWGGLFLLWPLLLIFKLPARSS